jgi:hypothetical protein
LIPLVEEESGCQHLQPLVYGTLILEATEFAGVIGHEIEIEFVYKLIIVHLIVKDPLDDAAEQRATPDEEELPRHSIVPSNQSFYNFLVSHFINVT